MELLEKSIFSKKTEKIIERAVGIAIKIGGQSRIDSRALLLALLEKSPCFQTQILVMGIRCKEIKKRIKEDMRKSAKQDSIFNFENGVYPELRRILNNCPLINSGEITPQVLFDGIVNSDNQASRIINEMKRR